MSMGRCAFAIVGATAAITASKGNSTVRSAKFATDRTQQQGSRGQQWKYTRPPRWRATSFQGGRNGENFPSSSSSSETPARASRRAKASPTLGCPLRIYLESWTARSSLPRPACPRPSPASTSHTSSSADARRWNGKQKLSSSKKSTQRCAHHAHACSARRSLSIAAAYSRRRAN